MDAPLKIDPQAVEAIARRVAELLGVADSAPMRFVDAAAVAKRLDVDREWVYAHANHLGAIRLGGPHGRLRFDLEVVKERLGGAEAASWRPPKRAPRRGTPNSRRIAGMPRDRKLGSGATTKSGRGARQRPRPDTGR